jgi:hypothetical protein
VPLPRGSGARATRTPWSAALGLFAAIPIAYLVLGRRDPDPEAAAGLIPRRG